MADTTTAVTPFNFNAHPVRVVVREGNPWFVASDVCAALGYANTSKAVADHLDEEERSHEQLDRSRMGSKSVVINESGLYALVLRSRKPEARKFAKWVTSEVLPTIRKTGAYESKPADTSPSRTELAMRGATMMASRVQEEVFQQLSENGHFVHDRWLLTFDLTRQGSMPRLLKLQHGADVGDLASLASRVSDESEHFSADDLIALAAAATQRLQRDMHPQQQLIANARH